MFTATIALDGITVTVRTRNRKTGILEGLYYAVLMDRFPELRQLDMPTDENAAVRVFNTQRAAFAIYTEAERFIRIMARITAVAGAPFTISADGRFAPEQIALAFDDMVNGEDDAADLWFQMERAIGKLDAPQTGDEVEPPEGMTDPNAAGAAPGGG